MRCIVSCWWGHVWWRVAFFRFVEVLSNISGALVHILIIPMISELGVWLRILEYFVLFVAAIRDTAMFCLLVCLLCLAGWCSNPPYRLHTRQQKLRTNTNVNSLLISLSKQCLDSWRRRRVLTKNCWRLHWSSWKEHKGNAQLLAMVNTCTYSSILAPQY